MLIKGILGIVHLGALIYFSLKYLRFDVKSNQQQTVIEVNNAIISEALRQVSEVEAELSPIETGSIPAFDRFVFVLLDAWRWNYLFSPNTEMKFLKQKLVDGDAIGMISLARVPTVTKPCLKSIFTGTLPVFFELVENIDESGVTDSAVSTTSDNLIHRLYRNEKKISVYGDDVWLKLFPESIFHRKNVSFGFNIMDYTSVDNMVHEGFDTEMHVGDSDVIILHYLGLDHIGHSFSAKSEYVDPKLKEMDAKASQIFDWITQSDAESGKKTLMLMMGDHGMTMDGNHGGGSKDESQAAAVFLSPHFKTKTAQVSDWNSVISAVELDPHNQEDIASTLTALLDTTSGPLKFGHGALIQNVINASFDKKMVKKVALQNLKHLIKLSASKPQEFEQIWSTVISPFEQLEEKDIYHISLQLKNLLNSDNFTFDETKLSLSLLILAMIVLISLFLFLKRRSKYSFKVDIVNLSCFVALVTLSLCQSATSFIAEEHLIWQSVTAVLFFIWFAKSNYINHSACAKVVSIVFIHRILCNWNSIGTLWFDQPTISTFIRSNRVLELFGVVAGLFLVLLLAFRRRTKHNFNLLTRCSQISVCICLFLHKSGFISEYVEKHSIARFTLALLILGGSRANLDISTAFFFILLNRPSNTTPIGLILLLSDLLNSLEVTIGSTVPSFLRICFMQSSYYWLGLWNSVSAVDLTNGAIFSKAFNMTLSPIVLLCYCLSGPILILVSSSSASNLNISEIFLFRSVLDFSACFFAFSHRFHPWNFDFFSPKILFQVFWGLFYFIIVPLANAFKHKYRS